MKKKNPKRLYFLAIVPGAPVQDEIMEMKRLARREFYSGHSLNSPAHITLIPPFYATEEEIESFVSALKVYLEKESSFAVKLHNFSHFGKRVIFVDVEKNERLENFQKGAFDFFKSVFPHYKKPNRFHPHVTVAFKDLTEEMFPVAWDFFKEEPYSAEFTVENVYLLKHKEKKWHTHAIIPLGGE